MLSSGSQPEFSGVPPEESPSVADTIQDIVLAFVGERKRVLNVGCGNGQLAKLLTERQCDIVALDANPTAIEAARPYSTRTILADLNVTSLATVLDGSAFDAIVFNGTLGQLRDPAKALEDARSLLLEGGFVVASVPNVAHGAIRLALLSGRLDYADCEILSDAHLRLFTAKSLDELFITAGYSVNEIGRTTAPIFGETTLVPTVDAADYPADTVAEVARDVESTTLQFVMKAQPLTNEARYRSLGKRYLTVNTELATALKRLEGAPVERARLEAALTAVTAELEGARTTAREAQANVARLSARVAESQNDHAEALALKAQHQQLATQHQEQLAKIAALTEKAHGLELELTRRSERTHFTELRLEESRVAGESRVTDLLGEISDLRDRLVASEARSATLVDERNDVKNQIDALERHALGLTGQREALVAERDNLKTLNAQITEEVHRLREGQATLAQLAETRAAQIAALNVERDEALASRNEALAARDQDQAAHSLVSEQHVALQKVYDESVERVTALKAQIGVIERRHDEASSQRNTLVVERDRLKETERTLAGRIAQLDEAADEARVLLQRANEERDAAMLEALEKDDAVAVLRREVDDAFAIAEETSAEADAARASWAATRSELADARSDLAAQTARVDLEAWRAAALGESLIETQRSTDAMRAQRNQALDAQRVALNQRAFTLRQLDAAVREKRAAAVARELAETARRAAFAERDNALEVRNAAGVERDAAQAERDAAQARADAAQAERDAALSQCDATAAEREIALSERDARTEDVATAQARAEATEIKNEALTARINEVTAEFVSHVTDLTQRTLLESTEVAALIDAAQVSKAWSLKGLFRRVFRRSQ